jgi:hypothetical protein
MHCIICKKDFNAKGWFDRHIKRHQESVPTIKKKNQKDSK